MHGIKRSVLLCVLVQSLVGGVTHAANAVDLALDQKRVLELMRQETEKLMPSGVDSVGVTTRGTDSLYLKAMYGVGKRLLAEVHWNGQDYVYLNGHTWPLGQAQKSLRLIRMAGRCITLGLQETQHQLCVRTPGGE